MSAPYDLAASLVPPAERSIAAFWDGFGSVAVADTIRACRRVWDFVAPLPCAEEIALLLPDVGLEDVKPTSKGVARAH